MYTFFEYTSHLNFMQIKHKFQQSISYAELDLIVFRQPNFFIHINSFICCGDNFDYFYGLRYSYIFLVKKIIIQFIRSSWFQTKRKIIIIIKKGLLKFGLIWTRCTGCSFLGWSAFREVRQLLLEQEEKNKFD